MSLFGRKKESIDDKVKIKEEKRLKKMRDRIEPLLKNCLARQDYLGFSYCIPDGPGAYLNREECPCYSNQEHPKAPGYIVCSYPKYELNIKD